MNFLYRFSEDTQISNFMEICQVKAELSRANRRTGRHDKANSRYSQNSFSFLQPNCKWWVSQLVSLLPPPISINWSTNKIWVWNPTY